MSISISKSKSNFRWGDIRIESNIDYWIYVLTDEQWSSIQSISTSKLYISSFLEYKIDPNDIILFYVKTSKTFVALASVQSKPVLNENDQNAKSLTKNTRLIKLFRDNNLNRYVIKLNQIKTFSIKTNRLTDQLKAIFGNAIKFGQKMKGECVFINVDTDRKSFISLIKKIKELDKLDSTPNIDLELDPDPDLDLDPDPDLDPDLDDSIGSIESIEPNVPILMVMCDKLTSKINSNISNSEPNINSTTLIYRHYLHCSKCDITNNGRELSNSITDLNLKDKEITFEPDNYVDILLAYTIDEVYRSTNESHHVSFHLIQSDPIYYNCVLIDYTSKVLNV